MIALNMKCPLSVVFVGAIILGATSASCAQRPECDRACVRDVRDLLKGSYLGISTSWAEKGNMRLGDKAGVAVLKIYRGQALYKPDNIRTFLPVLQLAFRDPNMIVNLPDRNPVVTMSLLRNLKRRVKDHFLNAEITKTLNIILFTPTPNVP
jgi:hypothetical protein